MVLWNFDLLWKNYGTILKKLWYYTENNSTLICEGKINMITNNNENLIDNVKN